MNPADLYIDLLTKVVTFSLWDNPGELAQSKSYRLGLLRKPAEVILNLFSRCKIDIRLRHGMFHPCSHTLMELEHIQRMAGLVRQVVEYRIPGDLIECGVARGGCCILMKGILEALGDHRKVFVADSFSGVPRPAKKRYSEDDLYKLRTIAIPKRIVENNFESYGLLDERVIFLEGLFCDTLPSAPIDKLSLLRLDGDLYESTLDGLVNLYHKLSPGGWCVIDDYWLEGCAKATDEFRQAHSVKEPLIHIEGGRVMWRKQTPG